jgi:hypothetical protein
MRDIWSNDLSSDDVSREIMVKILALLMPTVGTVAGVILVAPGVASNVLQMVQLGRFLVTMLHPTLMAWIIGRFKVGRRRRRISHLMDYITYSKSALSRSIVIRYRSQTCIFLSNDAVTLCTH